MFAFLLECYNAGMYLIYKFLSTQQKINMTKFVIIHNAGLSYNIVSEEAEHQAVHIYSKSKRSWIRKVKRKLEA